jgi:hypothetical protein
MSQHYTTNTVQADAWCNKCNKLTPHRVADRRLQYCIPCFDRSKELSEAEKAKPAQPEQGRLF